MNRIFVINPGSTSTKVAIYEEEVEVNSKTIEYESDVISKFSNFSDQYELRKKDVLSYLDEIGLKPENITAIAARGGGFGPMKAGAYLVNEALEKACHTAITHVSYLATVISYELVKEYGMKAYIYDALTAVDLVEHAKLSGLPEITRRGAGHVLNSRATARKAAQAQGLRYEENTFVVSHLGGGCTTSLHQNGRIIDVIGGDEGTFSPERAGRLPMRAFAKLCFSGKYTEKQVSKFFAGKGGLTAYLNSNDAREVEKMIASGDEQARLVYYSMAYQIIKDIGALYATMPDEVKGIVLTGGLAYSEVLMNWVIEKVQYLAPVFLYPGSIEMEALATGVLRVLRGEEEAHVMGGEEA